MNIDKTSIEKYLKEGVTQKKIEISDKLQINIDEIDYYNTYSNYDYFFPIHAFLPTNEAIPNLKINYNCTFNYLAKLRYEFVNICNKKYVKQLNNEDIKRLKSLESKHFVYSMLFYTIGSFFIFMKPLPRVKIVNYYIGFYCWFVSKYYSIYFIKNDVLELRDKIISKGKKLNKSEIEVYDYTLISDWSNALCISLTSSLISFSSTKTLFAIFCKVVLSELPNFSSTIV